MQKPNYLTSRKKLFTTKRNYFSSEIPTSGLLDYNSTGWSLNNSDQEDIDPNNHN
jgi:hypothetical protein